MKRLALTVGFLRLAFGVTLLSWMIVLPLIGMTFVFFPRDVVFLLAGISILSFLAIVTLPQWGILKLLKGQLPRTHGLRNSYEMAYANAGVVVRRRPILVTFADPIPNMFVIRAAGGNGMIILSEGFISILDESELRFVLTRAIRHLVSAEVVLQSACLLAMNLLRVQFDHPSGGVSAGMALKRLVLFPWLRFFSSLAFESGSVTRRVASSPGSGSGPKAEDFVRGASKLARAEQLYGQQAALPGLVYLGIQR